MTYCWTSFSHISIYMYIFFLNIAFSKCKYCIITFDMYFKFPPPKNAVYGLFTRRKGNVSSVGLVVGSMIWNDENQTWRYSQTETRQAGCILFDAVLHCILYCCLFVYFFILLTQSCVKNCLIMAIYCNLSWEEQPHTQRYWLQLLLLCSVALAPVWENTMTYIF